VCEFVTEKERNKERKRDKKTKVFYFSRLTINENDNNDNNDDNDDDR